MTLHASPFPPQELIPTARTKSNPNSCPYPDGLRNLPCTAGFNLAVRKILASGFVISANFASPLFGELHYNCLGKKQVDGVISFGVRHQDRPDMGQISYIPEFQVVVTRRCGYNCGYCNFPST